MLLNELKQIFEVDRDALQGALADLNIRTDITGFDKTDKKPGDVHPSVKSILQKSIVAAEYVVPSKDELEALTSTIEIKNRTLDSLNKLSGTLDFVEQNFTMKIHNLEDDISGVAAAEGGDVKSFTSNSLDNLRRNTSTIRETHREVTSESFSTRKNEITNMLMKVASATSYGNTTLTQINNFLKSKDDKGWFEADGTTVRASGITELKNRIERFYVILVTLQQNTVALTQQVTAIKAKGET